MLKAIVVENVRLNPSRMRVSVSLLFLKKYFQVITKTTEFEDDTGKKMKAEEIYDPLIKHLIEELENMFRERIPTTRADVRWVLMLPTQSNEGIIQVFHNAARKVIVH